MTTKYNVGTVIPGLKKLKDSYRMTFWGQLGKTEYTLYFTLDIIQTLEFLRCDNDIVFM